MMDTLNKKFDLSIILPSMNEGENVSKVLDEIIAVMKETGLRYEIIAIDTPTANPSYLTFERYAKEHDNIIAMQLDQLRPAGNDKSVKYMMGFEMAGGRYIIQMDTDGQDNPADLPKFLEKLDEGYDLVVGHKQNRKDGTIYMFTSKISNFLNRKLTGVEVHDMNCGFKGYPAHVAKSLNLRGRWYRFIPAILKSKGFNRICEVPIENRKREWGKTNFSFRNRLEGGLFDFFSILVLNYMGGSPFYFYGWFSMILMVIALALIVTSIFVGSLYGQLMFGISGILTIFLAIFNVIIGITLERIRFYDKPSLDSYGLLHRYPEVA